MNLNKLIGLVHKYGAKIPYFFNHDHYVYDHFREYRGKVKAVIEEDGVEFVAHENNNLIVHSASPAMAGLLAEADSDYVVSTFKIGTKGHDLGPPEDIMSPVSPSITDTALIDTSPFSKAIASFSYLPVGDPTSVQFVTVLEKAEANGSGSVTYTEAGLFMVGGNMYARETFQALVKNSSRKITFYWQILF
jgi:hypothetical protein